jgi:hypothetical protein
MRIEEFSQGSTLSPIRNISDGITTLYRNAVLSTKAMLDRKAMVPIAHRSSKTLYCEQQNNIKTRHISKEIKLFNFMVCSIPL